MLPLFCLSSAGYGVFLLLAEIQLVSSACSDDLWSSSKEGDNPPPGGFQQERHAGGPSYNLASSIILYEMIQ